MPLTGADVEQPVRDAGLPTTGVAVAVACTSPATGLLASLGLLRTFLELHIYPFCNSQWPTWRNRSVAVRRMLLLTTFLCTLLQFVSTYEAI